MSLRIKLNASSKALPPPAPTKLSIDAAAEVFQSTIKTRGVLMRDLNMAEIKSVAGGNDFMDRMLYGMPGVVVHDRIGGYWAQQWELWGPNRIGGYPQ